METESGIDFLSRISVKPLDDFAKELFSIPLIPPQLIEVSGPPGAGKSLLCLDLVMQALFPKVLFGIPLGGSESGVMFIDCDHHFNILHFTDMMERKIKRICHEMRVTYRKLGKEKEHEELMTIKKKDYNKQINNTIKNCLKNLIYINCEDSNHFAVILLSFEHYLTSESNFSLIVIDSISTFYWYDRVFRVENWQKMENYLNNIFRKFISVIKRRKLVCISIKLDLFRKRKDNDQGPDFLHNESLKINDSGSYQYLGKEWTNGVSIRINMALHTKRNEEENADQQASSSSFCTIETLQENIKKICHCTFHEDGVRWLKIDPHIQSK